MSPGAHCVPLSVQRALLKQEGLQVWVGWLPDPMCHLCPHHSLIHCPMSLLFSHTFRTVSTPAWGSCVSPGRNASSGRAFPTSFLWAVNYLIQLLFIYIINSLYYQLSSHYLYLRFIFLDLSFLFSLPGFPSLSVIRWGFLPMSYLVFTKLFNWCHHKNWFFSCAVFKRHIYVCLSML